MGAGVIDHDTAEAWAKAKRMATCESVPGAPPWEKHGEMVRKMHIDLARREIECFRRLGFDVVRKQ